MAPRRRAHIFVPYESDRLSPSSKGTIMSVLTIIFIVLFVAMMLMHLRGHGGHGGHGGGRDDDARSPEPRSPEPVAQREESEVTRPPTDRRAGGHRHH
jgi:hypothetical protein